MANWIYSDQPGVDTFFFHLLKVAIEILASDSMGAASLYKPIVRMCACTNGICLEDAPASPYLDDSSTHFKLLGCLCDQGYTGRLCENDLDACLENGNPCYPGVQCTDLPAPAKITGYSCGSCPEGTVGDGKMCAGSILG